ncbi:MAG TPA: hypothetical protein VFE17_09140 [Candidatus Baltobacteraceae bacterium]|nr:hypothetical protein [Candidatus Baltobacteraceae bacterium]
MFLRRWYFYVLTSAIVFGIEFAFYTFVRLPHGALYAELIGSPVIGTVVLVTAGFDATGGAPPGVRIERMIERAWAIIVLDAGLSMLTQAGFVAAGSGNAADTLLGIAVMFFAAMLVYAEPFAALEPSVQALTILPFAVVRSLMLAWLNMSRVFSLFAIQISVNVVDLLLLRAVAPKGGRLFDITDLAFVALVSAPLSVLFAVAYLDTLTLEPQRQKP